jgi:hypothetical protein
VQVGPRISGDNCCWYEGPKDVDIAGGSAGRSRADSGQEVWVYTRSTTLSFGLNACGDPIQATRGLAIFAEAATQRGTDSIMSGEDVIRGRVAHILMVQIASTSWPHLDFL